MRIVDRHESRRGSRQQPGWDAAYVAAELMPLFALALLFLGSQIAALVAIAFFFSGGLGWLLAGRMEIAVAVVLARFLLAAVAVAVAVSGLTACLFGCSAPLGTTFIVALVVTAALIVLTPAVSAIALWYTLSRPDPSTA